MTRSTSWQPVSTWYDGIVGAKGHYYHKHVVLPGVLAQLQLQPTSRILDLACGSGVLVSHLPTTVYYQGVDVARALIDAAKKQHVGEHRHFVVADLTRATLPFERRDFTHATIILALQNIKQPVQLLKHAAERLVPGGRLVIVLNHPCFRIPRQSSWGEDTARKTQYRRIDRYLSPLEIPITAHPGQKSSAVTWSFHQPLSAYTEMLKKSGFLIETMQEWASDKRSEGKAAKMENRSRAEIPLFLAITAVKK